MSTTLATKIRTSIQRMEREFARPAKARPSVAQLPSIQDQGLNHDTICLAYAVLSCFGDAKAFVYEQSQQDQNDLQRAYGINPEPLNNLNDVSPELVALVQKSCAADGKARKLPDTISMELEKLIASHPTITGEPEPFCRILTDEIAQILVTHEQQLTNVLCDDWAAIGCLRRLHGVRRLGLEWAFSPRNAEFLMLGDWFGDCTARKPSHRRAFNMHWTVYSWLMDPFYRVLQIWSDGNPVLKAHLLPLLIDDRRVLMVDALEAIRCRNQTHEPTARCWLESYSKQDEVMELLCEVVKKIGSRMGVDVVCINKCANSKWIREWLNTLRGDYYHVANVDKPFSVYPIMDMVERLLHIRASDVREAITSYGVSVREIERGLKRGYKEAAMLQGHLAKRQFIPVRGV